jgi:hypothetical protein
VRGVQDGQRSFLRQSRLMDPHLGFKSNAWRKARRLGAELFDLRARFRVMYVGNTGVGWGGVSGCRGVGVSGCRGVGWGEVAPPEACVARQVMMTAHMHPLCLLSNMSESSEERRRAFLKTDADWDTFSWSNADITLAADTLVRDFFASKRDCDVPRRRQAVYMLRVLLERHHDLMYGYLDSLCDDLLVRGLRVPDCETRKPEALAVHMLALLVPALVRGVALGCWRWSRPLRVHPPPVFFPHSPLSPPPPSTHTSTHVRPCPLCPLMDGVVTQHRTDALRCLCVGGCVAVDRGTYLFGRLS